MFDFGASGFRAHALSKVTQHLGQVAGSLAPLRVHRLRSLDRLVQRFGKTPVCARTEQLIRGFRQRIGATR
jgi:hypothetical protein